MSYPVCYRLFQFPKLKTASDTKGQDLEVALCSLLFLRGLRLCSAFFLGTNHANAGLFDDAVFIYRRCSVSQLRLLLVQTKHKQNMVVTYQTLLGSNNDFSLSKYQKSHNTIDLPWRSFSINGEILTRIRYIIYTNAPLKLNEDVGVREFSDDVCEFLLTSGGAHKFSLSDVEDAFQDENKKAAATFLEDFTLCHGQMNHKTSTDFIEEEIRLILKTGPEDTSRIRVQITALIKDWWEKRNEAEFQTRTSPIWRTIVKSRLENMNSETAKLAEKHRLTFEESSVHELKAILGSSRSLVLRVNSLAEATLVRLKTFQALEMALILSAESMTEDDLDQAFALWKTDFCDVLVVVKDSTFDRLESKLLKTLSLLNSGKCLLLVSTTDVDDSVWMKRSTGICWKDLDTETKSYLLNTPVKFQDSPAILSDLIGNRGDILSPEHILLLSKRSEDIVLGMSALRNKVVCYQNRLLTRKTCLNESFFQIIKKERAVCAFDSTPEGEGGRMLKGIPMVDCETFNNRRMLPNEGSEKLYKLRVINDEFIYGDCIGEGALNIVRKHLSDHVTEIIENIWEIEEKKVIINGYPGIGKSSFVTDMCLRSVKSRPFEWAVRVNIREHRDLLKDLKRQVQLILPFS